MAPGAAEAEANEPVPFTLRFSSKGVIWDPETTAGNGITREEFTDQVEEQNPVLTRDRHKFLPNKSYMLPENDPGSTELSWTRSLLGFGGSRWAGWQQHVAEQVRGITWAQ